MSEWRHSQFITKSGKSEDDLAALRQEFNVRPVFRRTLSNCVLFSVALPQILRPLRNDNIIMMLDCFETPRDFCVVMEFAHGELFRVLEDDKRLPEPVVQSIARQLVHALHYLHSNRIIHRDMKPHNILIGTGGKVLTVLTVLHGVHACMRWAVTCLCGNRLPVAQVKLCDFGFARAMSYRTVVLTSIKGVPALCWLRPPRAPVLCACK